MFVSSDLYSSANRRQIQPNYHKITRHLNWFKLVVGPLKSPFKIGRNTRFYETFSTLLPASPSTFQPLRGISPLATISWHIPNQRQWLPLTIFLLFSFLSSSLPFFLSLFHYCILFSVLLCFSLCFFFFVYCFCFYFFLYFLDGIKKLNQQHISVSLLECTHI